MITKKTLIACVFLLLILDVNYACDCIPASIKVAVRNVEYIVIGEIIESNHYGTQATLLISEVLKGNFENKNIKLRTPSEHFISDCDRKYPKGRYILFLYKNHSDNTYTSHICSWSSGLDTSSSSYKMIRKELKIFLKNKSNKK